MKKKILITGANGFIGRNLVRGLKDEFDVTPLTRQEVDLTNARFVNKFFENKQFDIIIHCAVIGGNRLKQDDNRIILQNLEMVINLMNHKNKFNQFINLDSGASLYKLNTPYGKSKKLINSFLDSFYKINISNLKIYNVFGEDELETRFIKANILRYIKKEPIIVHQNIEMDFFYIEDFITLIKYVIDDGGSWNLDCCYENKEKLSNIAEMINQLNNYQVPILIENNGYEAYIGDCIEIPNLIGLEEGIKRVYNKLKNEF